MQLITEQRLRELHCSRTWAAVRAMSVALTLFFCCFAVLVAFQKEILSALSWLGPAVARMAPAISAASGLAVLVLLFYLVGKYTDRFKIGCPKCNDDVSTRIEYLRLTRSCPSCNQRIVEGGRVRSSETFKRYQRLRGRSFLKHWLWVWPIAGGVCLAIWVTQPAAFGGNPTIVCLFPLIGTAVAGWSYIRTLDRRYAPQLLASFVCFCIAAMMCWREL